MLLNLISFIGFKHLYFVIPNHSLLLTFYFLVDPHQFKNITAGMFTTIIITKIVIISAQF